MHNLLIALIPIVFIAYGFVRYPNKFTIKEGILSVIVGAVVSVILIAVSNTVGFSDTEALNGAVTEKVRKVEDYRRTYDCKCRTKYKTGSNGKRTSYQKCQTCTERGYDFKWGLKSDIGYIGLKTARCKSNSLDRPYCERKNPDPERWLNAQVGEGVTRTNTYDNYIKAAEYSLFNMGPPQEGEQSYPIPAYPLRIYDGYKLDRVLPVGLELTNLPLWNATLQDTLKTLGPQKHANIVVVMIDHADVNHAYQIIQNWEGGAKNDIIIMAGFPDGLAKPAWVKTFAWSISDIVNVQLREQLINTSWEDPVALFATVHDIVVEHYTRRPMKDFEHLAAGIDPPLWVVLLCLVLSTLVGYGLFRMCRDHDVI